jgi:hypothetical protein
LNSDEPHPAAKPLAARAALEFTIHRAVLLPNSEEDVEVRFGTHAESVNSSADPRTPTSPTRRHAADRLTRARTFGFGPVDERPSVSMAAGFES